MIKIKTTILAHKNPQQLEQQKSELTKLQTSDFCLNLNLHAANLQQHQESKQIYLDQELQRIIMPK